MCRSLRPSALRESFARAPFSLALCLLFAYSAVHDIERRTDWRRDRLMNWDIEAYHHYLPALFIHGDVRDLSYVPALDSALHGAAGPIAHAVRTHPATGHQYTKYAMGVALFQLPGFLVAHAITRSGLTPYPADGYSIPYRWAIQLSTALAVIIGLLVLRRLLLRHASDTATTLTLIAIGLGTNLYYYTTVEAGMSHGYLFLLTALVAERCDAWYRQQRTGALLAMAACVGLAVLTRPVEGLLLLVPLGWGLGAGAQRARAWQGLRARPAVLLRGALIAFACVLPQLLYWKATTGQWLYFSYDGEGFNFGDPHVLDGLFSYRKGWLVYSPLVALGFVGIALAVFRRPRPAWLGGVLLYLVVALYVVFSWHQWWYGGSFGCRALVGALPLLALPMAYLFQVITARGHLATAALALVVLAGVRLNLFQQEQYLASIIHWDSMTRERYWEVWGVDRWDKLTPFP